MAAGIALAGVGLALMVLFVSVDGGYLSILPGMLAMGIGMGLSMIPSTEAISASLPREKQGVASALGRTFFLDRRTWRRDGTSR